jgi:hypothetical protein
MFLKHLIGIYGKDQHQERLLETMYILIIGIGLGLGEQAKFITMVPMKLIFADGHWA